MQRGTIALVALLALAPCGRSSGDSWPRFRGDNARGVADALPLPADADKDKSLVWRAPLPPGFSSPVIDGGRVYVTGYEGDKLFTVCVDAAKGGELWRREAPRARTTRRPVNTPVSTTAATDARGVYVLFEDFGLLAYAPDGKERWRKPLGPFKLPYGLGTSPIVADGKLIVLIDQDTDSFLAAYDTQDGRELWRTERPEAQHGFSTPVVYRPAGGEPQLVVLGSLQLAGYSLETGQKLWWLRGMAWQAKSTPVIDGDDVYVNSSMPNMAELDKRETLADFAAVLKEKDADHDGKIASSEAPVEAMKKLWFLYDLDQDGLLDEHEWNVARSRDAARSGLYAVRLGGKGDLTESAVRWRHEKSIPNIPTPILYKGVLFVLREGGILTTLDPQSGRVLKQGRLAGALDPYFASPVAGDAKIYFASQSGKVTVVTAAGDWESLGVSDLGEEIWSTPALADGRLFIRTQKALYCFGRKAS
jgi:outer membrane protein assembly factor BamB